MGTSAARQPFASLPTWLGGAQQRLWGRLGFLFCGGLFLVLVFFLFVWFFFPTTVSWTGTDIYRVSPPRRKVPFPATRLFFANSSLPLSSCRNLTLGTICFAVTLKAGISQLAFSPLK